MKVSIAKAKELIPFALKAGLVPMLHGSPALGKSSIVHQIAKVFRLKLIDLRLSQCDPTDLLGFPFINNGRSGYAPMDSFPLEGDPLPSGCDGWLLFLDEIVSAPQAVQAAAYKLILDRMVGNRHLHPKVVIVAAGNLETDGAVVNPLSTALASRMMHLFVELNTKDWLKWAYEEKLDHRITSYIEFQPDKLYTFDPGSSDVAYASPRTWHFCDALFKHVSLNRDTLPMFAGNLSEGVARGFMGFCQNMDNLPKIGEILAAPNKVAIPGEPSFQYAIVGSLAAHATTDNCDKLMDYLQRMPAEFQVVGIRSMLSRDKALLSVPAVTEWVSKTSADLF